MKEGKIVTRIVRVIAATLLLQLLMCYPLWTNSHRIFPKIPPLSFLPLNWDSLTSVLLYIGMLASVTVLIVKPFNRLALRTLIACFLLLLAEDINRLQPWFYLYLLMLSSLFVCGKEKPGYALTICRLVLSSAYFWSGLQKLNVHFAIEVFPWLWNFAGLEHFLDGRHYLAYIAASLEALSGICLWIKPLRKATVFFILATHLLILISLGPLSHNWNEIVWPWNILFAYLVFELFYRSFPEKGILFKKSTFKVSPMHFASVLILASILPGFGLFGMNDHFLSDGFYSAMPAEPYFYFPSSETGYLPKIPTTYLYPAVEDKMMEFRFNYWAVDELKVPIYPQNWVYKEVAKKLCRIINDDDSTFLEIDSKTRFSEHENEIIWPCRQLTTRH